MTEYIFREVHYGYTDGTALGCTLEKQEEIVRCRDCKSYGLGRRCGWSKRFVTPDGFCAWGERRERESAEVWNQWSADDVTCSEES